MELLPNTRQSDITVKIYTFVNFIFNPELLSEPIFDIGSYLTYSLSQKLGNSWIVRAYDIKNILDMFSRNIDAISKQEGFINTVMISPSMVFSRALEIQIFLDTLLRTSYIHHDKVIILLNEKSNTDIDRVYTERLKEQSNDKISSFLITQSMDFSAITLANLSQIMGCILRKI